MTAQKLLVDFQEVYNSCFSANHFDYSGALKGYYLLEKLKSSALISESGYYRFSKLMTEIVVAQLDNESEPKVLVAGVLCLLSAEISHANEYVSRILNRILQSVFGENTSLSFTKNGFKFDESEALNESESFKALMVFYKTGLKIRR